MLRRASPREAPPWSDQRTLVFLGAWLLLLLGGRSRLLQDPGTFWHTVVGERILRSGLPRADWLSFTFGSRPWIAQQWLSECAMAALHRLGGLDALVVATAAAVALLLAWLFHRLVAAGVTPMWAVLVVVLALLASALHLHVRPHVLSILFFAWMYGRLVDFESGRLGVAALAWLVPLWAIWANCHGAVLGGLATYGLSLAAWTAAALLEAPSPVRSARAFGALALLSLAGAASLLLNPYGLELPRAWGAILESRELPRAFMEHASMARTGSYQVLALGALLGAAILGVRLRSLTATSVLPVVWLGLAVDRIRNAPLFAVAATLALAEILPRARWASKLSERGVLHVLRTDGRRSAGAFPRAPLALGAAALVTVGLLHAAAPGRGPFLARLDPQTWPVELLPELRRAAAELPAGSPILNDMRLGGFLAYHAPRLRISIDDRWELYGDAYMRDFLRGDAQWFEQLARRHGVALALAEPGTPLARYLERSAEWRRVASSPAAALFSRSPATSAPSPVHPQNTNGSSRHRVLSR